MHLYLFWTLFQQMPKPFFKNLPQNSKCKLLMLPQIEKKYANPNGIQIDLMQRIRRVFQEVNLCVVTSTPAKTR